MITTQHNPILPAGRAGRPMCPICGRDGCGQSHFTRDKCPTGVCTVAVSHCHRVESHHTQNTIGAWPHYRTLSSCGECKDFAPSGYSIPRVYAPPPIAPAETRNEVYAALLKRLDLSPNHRAHLTGIRKLGEATIDDEGYRSIPAASWASLVASELARDYDLKLVPGFFLDDRNRPRVQFGAGRGIIIPIRDQFGRISALQIRTDSNDDHARYRMVSSARFPNGASSRAPAHYAHPERAEAGVIITEGALKAQIVAEYEPERAVVGLVSVSSFSFQFGWELRDALPNLSAVAVAFDLDHKSNPNVAHQLKRLRGVLGAAGIRNAVMDWDPRFKGYDDFLTR